MWLERFTDGDSPPRLGAGRAVGHRSRDNRPGQVSGRPTDPTAPPGPVSQRGGGGEEKPVGEGEEEWRV